MMTLQCTQLSREDLPAVAALHAPYTPRRSDVALLRWQFFDDALPREGILIGAWDGVRLIGTQAFIPIAAHMSAETLLSAKSELTLVHPDYRGQGVFEAMMTLGLERCIEAGIHCVWGFTSATKAFGGAGFSLAGPLVDEYIVLRPTRFALARAFSPAPLPALPRGASQALIPDGVSEPFPGAEAGTPPFTIHRTADWLQYRYERNPWTAITACDTRNGLLYTQDPARTDVVRISEVPGPEALAASLKHFVPRQPSGWTALYRFTNTPLARRMIGKALVIPRVSQARIVWKWLGPHVERPCPPFRIEEGYREGV